MLPLFLTHCHYLSMQCLYCFRWSSTVHTFSSVCVMRYRDIAVAACYYAEVQLPSHQNIKNHADLVETIIQVLWRQHLPGPEEAQP